MSEAKIKKFNKFLPVVILTVFALIAIGGIVRSTGSGMGCPDWPRCFGQLIPPTDISELPVDYKERFAVAGRTVADFSVVKTWTEYLNRLFGVWTGIAILILSYFSFGYKKSRPEIFKATILSLILVVLNGWIGAKVVSTHLKPVIITAHMLLAIFLVFALQFIKHKVQEPITVNVEKLKKYHGIMWILIILTLIQVVFGTQVREQVDHITNNFPNLARSNWLGRLDWTFYFHRSYSIVIFLGSFYVLRNLMEDKESRAQGICISYMMILFGEIAAGVALAYFSFPPVFQPIHLLLAVVLMSYQYEILMVCKNSIEAKSA